MVEKLGPQTRCESQGCTDRDGRDSLAVAALLAKNRESPCAQTRSFFSPAFDVLRAGKDGYVDQGVGEVLCGFPPGKVTRFDTRSAVGLVAEIKIAGTPRGDETLQLASEDMLSASIGFIAGEAVCSSTTSPAPAPSWMPSSITSH